jgi:glutamate dehydrogenase/leucine dehydrogenase
MTSHPIVSGALDDRHEQLVIVEDPGVGLMAVICIDSTVLGPADGGVRMFPYATLEAAIGDVTHLARAMTLKWAVAGVARGGGKAVIVGDPAGDKSAELFQRFGMVVESLNGRYWAGADAGITLDDLEQINTATSFVSTLPIHAGGSGDIGPFTAAGVLHGMRACLGRVRGDTTLAGRKVALQGLGSCGMAALAQLVGEGSDVVVTDTDPTKVGAAVAAHGVRAVEPHEILSVSADVFAPFALGGVIDRPTAEGLDVAIVAGSANNVMADDDAEAVLVDRGITYAVDFVTNAGGAIADAHRLDVRGGDLGSLDRELAAIGQRVLDVLDRADDADLLPSDAARTMAEERLEGARAGA